MKPIFEEYITKLTVISKIPINGRLDTTKNDINIYKPHNILVYPIYWLFRVYNEDSRDKTAYTLKKLYSDIGFEANDLVYSLILSVKYNSLTEEELDEKYSTLVNLAMALNASVNGIKNLAGTYNGDEKMVSFLESLVENSIKSLTKKIINKLPDKYIDSIKRPRRSPFSHGPLDDIIGIESIPNLDLNETIEKETY